MRTGERFRAALFGLACGLFSAFAWADEPCRIAFDIGSSGIRAGASNSRVTTKTELDYLGPLSANRGLEATAAATIDALKELPEQGGFAADCARVAGGFSAWRLALQQGAGKLASTLAHIEAASGVAVLVIPQTTEGSYAYFGARQLLGEKLTTSHVLDVGGGSLQIAGERSTFGDALGQKIWHQYLCRKIRHSSDLPCALQPMTAEEVVVARRLLAERLADLGKSLPEPVTMTAISRPVTQGVLPAVKQLAGETGGENVLLVSAITASIATVAHLTLEETATLVRNPAKYASYLLSDMLLVEGLLKATGGSYLLTAEIGLTNLPGLLADDRAFQWAAHYGCYLDRLRHLGAEAYASDPERCTELKNQHRLPGD